MSFAISWQPSESNAGGFLLFDAVTSWNRSYSGTVSEHPIDSGGSVADHFVSANPTFTMSAVISAEDISTTSALLADADGNEPLNATMPPEAVIVGSTDQSLLMKYIPNTVGQFLPDTLPTVIMDDFKGDVFGASLEGIQDILTNLISGEGVNQITGQWEAIIRPVELYETDNFLTLVKKLPADINKSLILTGLNFREDTETGQGLYVDMTFRLVRFANLKKVTLPPDVVQAALKDKAASKNSLGKADSTKNDADASNQTPAQERKSTAVKAFEAGNSAFFKLGGTL